MIHFFQVHFKVSGLRSLIVFSLFATSVIDTGDKFAAGVVDTGGKLPTVENLPPVSMTLVILVANLSLVLLIPVVHLDFQISP